MSLLQGTARERYIEAFTGHNTANLALSANDRLEMDDLLTLVINDTSKKYFSLDCDWRNAYQNQKAYMRKTFYGRHEPRKILCRALLN